MDLIINVFLLYAFCKYLGEQGFHWEWPLDIWIAGHILTKKIPLLRGNHQKAGKLLLTDPIIDLFLFYGLCEYSGGKGWRGYLDPQLKPAG